MVKLCAMLWFRYWLVILNGRRELMLLDFILLQESLREQWRFKHGILRRGYEDAMEGI